jgi:hypothetical protein
VVEKHRIEIKPAIFPIIEGGYDGDCDGDM